MSEEPSASQPAFTSFVGEVETLPGNVMLDWVRLVGYDGSSVGVGIRTVLFHAIPGELWAWGSNTYSQLGFALPAPVKPDEEPISTTPRQVFGPLKKEIVLGAAASAIHSVAHTGSSLFCWGKNIGQLALMDADSRSLEVQTTPRKVAATLLSSHSSIVMVSAIDKATTCLFEDHMQYEKINYHFFKKKL